MSVKTVLFLGIFGLGLSTQAQTKKLTSPDNSVVVTISLNDTLRFSVVYQSKPVIENCAISLNLPNKVFGVKPRVTKSIAKTINETQTLVVAYKQSTITDACNELTLRFKDNYSVVFRAYNNGVAYRFETTASDSLKINQETMQLNFGQECSTYFPEETSFISHYEGHYKHYQVNKIADSQFCSLPVYMKTQSGISLVFTETDVYDYPNLFLKGTHKNGFSAIQPREVLKAEPHKRHPDRYEEITATAPYIASVKGTRTFPWRVFMVSENDNGIVENALAYQLASPNQIPNAQWIKPGKVAWDWWNANNIYGVDFKSGINTETYKYYIDFAANFGLEYIILDEGWSKTTMNVLENAPGIDVQELVAYGNQKKVGVILWLLWKPLDLDMENILKTYAGWGVKGIKVDFMQRADQYMVNYYTRVAQTAAKYQLFVDFHGAYKPSGLQKAYPNVLSHEGVLGLENNKWGNEITPEHDLILPFTRMTAGPMDYTPGAMDNAFGKDFFDRFNRPMSQGTRAHQVAMYVVYESPLQMLADNPSNYYRETPCTQFIAKIPVTWDETHVLQSQIADYIVLARRKGNQWFIGAMTDENPRDFDIDLSFIPKEFNQIEFLADGINADRVAVDYKKGEITRPENNLLKIHLAPGGGYVAILSKGK